MKIIFMGTPDFAVPTLKKLIQSPHQLVLVVTGVDKPRGRGQKLSPTAVKLVAIEHKLPLYQPESLRLPEVEATLRQHRADLFVVVAFRILPESLIDIPPKGVINLHASLLPKYRGAAPIQWAILNGETETGVTTFFIEKQVDTGDIILQRNVEILPEDTAGILHDRLAKIGAETILATIELIAAGREHRKIQTAESTKAPKITKEMCQIDWNRPARQIVNQIRAFSPVPSAFTYLGNALFKIYLARVAALPKSALPGTIHIEKQKLFVRAQDDWLEILELQVEGKKRLPAGEFLPGFSISENACFRNIAAQP